MLTILRALTRRINPVVFVDETDQLKLFELHTHVPRVRDEAIDVLAESTRPVGHQV